MSCLNYHNLQDLMYEGDQRVYTPECQANEYAVGGGCRAGTTGVVIASHPDYREDAGSALPPKRWVCLLRKPADTNFDKYDAYHLLPAGPVAAAAAIEGTTDPAPHCRTSSVIAVIERS